MVLAQNETLIKEWQYGYAKTKKEKIDKTLSITDKRIVLSAKGGLTNESLEFRNRDVTSVYACNVKKSLAGAIFAFIIGLLAIVIGAVTGLVMPVSIIGFVIVFFALVSIYGASSNLTLNICTEKSKFTRYGVLASISGTTFKRKNSKIIKIKVNKEVADDIVETIGSVLLTGELAAAEPQIIL